MTRLITLLTDFGTADGFVGEMKGMLASGAPGCQVVDIAHDLAAQDVDAARLALARYWQRFPPGTVHVAVVDPGVGGTRHALAVQSAERLLVGPDNGLLSPALLLPDARCVTLPIPAAASATFHGRDVFAPAAARLAMGAPLDEIGRPFDEPVILRTPEAVRDEHGDVRGIVIAIDRFGNVLTNLMSRHATSIHVAGRDVPLAHTYGDVAPGALVALIASSGFIEVAQRDGRASDVLGVSRGDPVVMRAER